jgi:O2-independent ubiquinone biosynthesis accessory factor UbiT
MVFPQRPNRTGHSDSPLTQPRKLLARLPRLLVAPALHAPFPLQRLAMVKTLKHIFGERLAGGEFDFLQQRWLQVTVTDLQCSWLFSCSERRDVLMQSHGRADVTIKGSMKSFLALAAGHEDADTLFFQRELLIEGDTELGLQIKNLLDGLDLRQLPPELLFTLRTGAEFTRLFC